MWIRRGEIKVLIIVSTSVSTIKRISISVVSGTHMYIFMLSTNFVLSRSNSNNIFVNCSTAQQSWTSTVFEWYFFPTLQTMYYVLMLTINHIPFKLEFINIKRWVFLLWKLLIKLIKKQNIMFMKGKYKQCRYADVCYFQFE